MEKDYGMFGYARVSSKDQSADRQLIALREYGIERGKIYCDKASGKDFNRPAYQRLIKRMKPGDLLAIKSIDRLGRDCNEILEEWRRLTKGKGMNVVVLDMLLLDTRQKEQGGITGVFMADLVLQMLSCIAQAGGGPARRRADSVRCLEARRIAVLLPAALPFMLSGCLHMALRDAVNNVCK